MWNRRWIIVAALAVCIVPAAHWATPLAAQQKDDQGGSDKQSEKKKEQELDVRYAKAYLRLAEATLAKYEAANRKLPRTIRPSVMDALKEEVREAQERVQLAESDDTSDVDIFVSSADMDLHEAQVALDKAERTNLQQSGTVSDEEIARLKADLDLAKIRKEKAGHLGAESSLSGVRFELEQLREEVAELRMFVAILRDRN